MRIGIIESGEFLVCGKVSNSRSVWVTKRLLNVVIVDIYEYAMNADILYASPRERAVAQSVNVLRLRVVDVPSTLRIRIYH